MNTNPFTPFFGELISEGFILTLRDYERLIMALQSKSDWNIRQIRSVLQCLIVKNEDQQYFFDK